MFDPQLGPEDQKEPERKPLTAGERRFVIWFSVLLFAGFAAEVLRGFTPAKLSLLFFLLFYPPLTAFHEAGHALVARWVGWRVERVVVGVGPIWRRWELDGVPVELRRVPLGGFVVPVPERLDRPRLSNALIFAAGPGAELLVVALLVVTLGWDTLTSRTTSVPLIAAQSLAAAAAVGAIHNLIPFRTAEGQASDGLGILNSFSLTRDDLRVRQAIPALLEAETLLTEGDLKGGFAALNAARDRHADVLVVQLMAAEMEARLGERKGEVLMELAHFARTQTLSADERALVEATLDRIRAL